jgi:hypothetical protein
MTNRIHRLITISVMPRIIYSLRFNLERAPRGEIVQLVAPLDTQGQSQFCEALLPVERVIDLRPGDEVWHEPGKRAYLIKGVEAYRDNHMSREQVLADPPTESYILRES